MLPLCQESTPGVGHTEGGREVPALWSHPRDPMCRGYGPTCKTHIRLGLLCEGSASGSAPCVRKWMLQGPATSRDSD